MSKKPRWPHPECGILTAHSNGQWCKKKMGKLYYFGPWADADGALERWLKFARCGPEQVNEGADNVDLAYALNEYLVARRADNERGVLSLRQFGEYVRLGRLILQVMGRGRLLGDVGPVQFAELRNRLPGGLCRQTNGIRWSRCIFNWISEQHGVHFRFGPEFKPPKLSAVRMGRKTRAIDASSIRGVLERGTPAMKAMILLGINGGFGPSDFASLRHADVDLGAAIIRCARPKTGVSRIVPLWPETVKALRGCRCKGPLWSTTRNGMPWVRESAVKRPGSLAGASMRHDPLRLQLRRLKATWTLYELRHTFRSVAGETGDIEAVRLVMGHAVPGVDEHYVHVNEQRCRTVVDHVRRWFYGGKESSARRASPAQGRSSVRK